jgi:hypothetical protein
VGLRTSLETVLQGKICTPFRVQTLAILTMVTTLTELSWFLTIFKYRIKFPAFIFSEYSSTAVVGERVADKH